MPIENWSPNILNKIYIDEIVKIIIKDDKIYSGYSKNFDKNQINIVNNGWLSPLSKAQEKFSKKITLNSDTSSCW